ncbi:type II secretion system protein GspL [Thiohalorhabdus sp.]|uniref:type II secretion system protein GspL n=1 Tax=Thiohalorhabdus sp. TaxID=3094134 RepID=UPI002FC356B5
MAISGEYCWVYLGADSVYWARRYGKESQPREEGVAATLEEAPLSPGARVVACVPGQSVRLHWVAIPARNRKRLLEALPFTLEEELLQDPGAYHLVPLKAVPGMRERAVAVAEHERMAAWFQLLTERGLRPRALLPDYLGVAPPNPGTWVLDATRSPFLLRRPEGFGGASLPGEVGDRPPGALLLALEEARVPPEMLQVRVASEADRQRLEAWEPWLEPFGVTTEVAEDTRSREAWLARQPLPGGQANLLTGPYTSRGDPRVLARRLAPAAGLALALVAVAAVQWLLEGQRIRAEHQRLEAAIEETYRDAFPESRNIVDPRFQMANRLEKLREDQGEASGRADLVAILRRVAPALNGETDRRLKSVTFNGRALVMEVSVPDYGALEGLENRLGRLGTVEVEEAELVEGRVAGRLRFEGAA